MSPATPSRRLLFVVDYPGRREEARVTDLHLEEHGFDVRYLLTAPFVQAVRARAYAQELLDRSGPESATPAAVVAYCMAAPIAQELAALLSRDGAPVPLILFDGEPATPQDVEEQYRLASSQLTGQIGGGATGPAHPGVFDDVMLAERPEAAVAAMRQDLLRLGTAALAEDEEPDEEAVETAGALTDFLLNWIIHLVAAHNASWPAWGGPVLHVVSADHRYTRPWPGASTTRVVRVASPRAELLRIADAGALVDAFLAAPHHATPVDDCGETCRTRP